MCCDPDEPNVDEEDYLACIPWDGNEKTLPAGGDARIPMPITDLAIPESIKKTRYGVIYYVMVDEGLYQDMVKTFGVNAFMISLAEGSGQLNRPDWKKQYGTDGLKLWVLRNLRMEATG